MEFGFRDSFVIIDDGELSDALYVQFNELMDKILTVINQPECDSPSFVFDVDMVSTYHYIQTWFIHHSLFAHEKEIELYYPKLNITDHITVNRDTLDRLFGVDFLKKGRVDLNYISNLKYIQS